MINLGDVGGVGVAITRHEFKRLRLALKMSQAAFARELKFSHSVEVSKIERGADPISPKVERICELLMQVHGINVRSESKIRRTE